MGMSSNSSMRRTTHLLSVFYIDLDGYGDIMVALTLKRGPKFGPCYIQWLGKYTSFCSHRHKICITQPARKHVQVNVVGDAGTSGLAEVEAHVDAARSVHLAQRNFGALRKQHQLIGSLGRKASK